MKQRFSSLDIHLIAHELSHSLTGLRLSNVYDLSSRIFLLKFATPNRREQLLIDAGFRCHLTAFSRATAATPSPFVARLRKFLRTRRVVGVRQVGTDRVIEVDFGRWRLFLEFYAGGNVVLVDFEEGGVILGLWRGVGEGEAHAGYRAGAAYELEGRQNVGGTPEVTRERVREGLSKAVERQAEEAGKPGKKFKRKAGGDALRRALAVTTTEFPPVLIEHGLRVAGVGKEVLPEEVVASEELLEKVLQALAEAKRVVEEIVGREVGKGYIVAKRKPGATDDQEGNLIYDDFHPFKPAQLADDPAVTWLEFEGFNKTVDEFFSSIEGQKLESRLQEREDNAKRKIEHARQEQAKRLDGLQHVQELNERKAQAIEANVERVEEAVAAVNGLISQGMDWVDIGKLVQNEQRKHNAVAELIKLPLKLQENTVTLLLSELHMDEDDELDETDSEPSDTEDEDDDTPQPTSKRAAASPEDKRLPIDIDLALSAWSNARHYYDHKRTAASKQSRTALASTKALKSTEQKVLADLKKGLKQEKDILRPVRKPFWFEKFVYFLSSDRHLVLAAKDAQQAELLYRKYLRKGDVYVSADLAGAASVVVKNSVDTPEAPIPPSTLAQAGNLAVCTSGAWESKAVMSAWWVGAEQVSKTAGRTGEFLAPGEFEIRGKRNFLPPAQLLLGFGVMFQISEESVARHVKHRALRVEEGVATPELTDAETLAESEAVGESGESSDDDFPDAHVPGAAAPGPGPSALRFEQGVESEDDDFPDVLRRPADLEEISDGEVPEDQAERTYGEHHSDEEEGEERAPRGNPLQSGGSAQTPEDEGDDERDENDEEEGEHEDETLDGKKAEAEEEPTARPDTHPPTEPADDDDAATKPAEGEIEPPKLSNKERKALQRHEKGKPLAPALKPAANEPARKSARGQKSKAKKIATKYAEQDAEDRALAMQLLGSRGKEEEKKPDGGDSEAAAKTESAEEARARRRAQHERTQREGLESEAQRAARLKEGVEALDEDEVAALTQLEALVGTPLVGDEILEALPVCAPWAALGRYKYKVKLQPGQTKKGKAVREILGRWGRDSADGRKVDNAAQDVERIWPREGELVRGWREAEVIGVVPVKAVRVVLGGAGGEKGRGGAKGKGGRGGKGSKRR